MTLEEVMNEWTKDCVVDQSELGAAALNIPKLHNKYYKMFANERLRLRKMESDHKELKLEVFVFYTEGPSKEQVDAGWDLPPRGRILKTEAPAYVDTDEKVVTSNLKVAYQREKVEAIESIIKAIKDMGFQINSAIQWEKFKVGA